MHYQSFRPHVLALAMAAAFPNFVLAEEAELPEVEVQGATVAADPVHGSSATATKLDVPLRDVPQAVQIVTKELIEEQGALEMKDVLRNVSGVSLAQGEGRRDQFYIRGFDATRDTLLDGMRDDSLYFRDLGSVERIEVLKGPAAVLYGRGSAGGVINRITKKPQRQAIGDVKVTVGSENLSRIDLDLGDALGNTAAFRITGAYEKGDSFRDVVDSERTVLSPSISWMVGVRTNFLLQTEFLHQNRTPDRGIPSLNGRPAKVSVHNFYGEKYDFATTDAFNTRFNVDHVVNDKLTLRNNFQFSTLSLDAINTRTLGLTADKTMVRRQITFFPQDQTNYLNQTEAVYKLDTGILQHTLLAGLELGYQRSERLVRARNTTSVSLQDPQHQLSKPDTGSLPTTFDTDFNARTVATYAQDQINLGQHWKALAGVRFDRLQQTFDNNLANTEQERKDSVWSPRVGIVYQPVDTQAFYGNISRSFQPVGSDLFFSRTNFAQIKPVESNQQELGVKSDWLRGNLVSTVALYKITQRNVVTTNPNDPTGLTQLQTGEQQSKGLEVDLSGTLTPGWKVFANYTLNVARITKSNDFEEGNRPANIPRNAASLWTTYQLGRGFTIGGGAFYVGDRYAVEDNTVQLPSYVRIDAMLAYKAKEWETGLNINNLGNRTYYESANNNFQIQPGATRNALLYVRTTF